MLLDLGADPDTKNERTSITGSDAIVRMLLDLGADPNTENEGDTPLHDAAQPFTK
ncbi:hypothetical protein T484DRAFT_1873141 [Baffinella frigidus]|nr:hypothetical protein T484DRAFT_1873141 [Cryptophyta sp. CCMP2293]